MRYLRHPRCDECIASAQATDGQDEDDTPKPRREFLVPHPTAPLFDQIWKKSCCQHDLFMSIISGEMEAKMLTNPVAIPEHGINRFDFAPKFGMISASVHDDIQPFESNRIGSLTPHLLFAKQNSPGFLQNHASERFLPDDKKAAATEFKDLRAGPFPFWSHLPLAEISHNRFHSCSPKQIRALGHGSIQSVITMFIPPANPH